MKRLIRVIKWTAITAIVLVSILLLVNAIWAYRANSALEAKLTEIRQDDQPLSLEQWLPEAIPDDRNAAHYLRLAQPAAERIQEAVKPLRAADPRWEDELSAEEAETVRTALEANDEALRNIRRAAACEAYVPLTTSPRVYAPMVSDMGESLDTANRTRSAARVIHYHASLALADGDTETALQDAIDLFRIADLYRNNPTMIHGLVSAALRSMAADIAQRSLLSGDLPDASLQRLDEQLQKDDVVAAFRGGIVSERCIGLTGFEHMQAKAWIVPLWTQKEVEYLTVFDWVLDHLELKSTEFSDQLAARYLDRQDDPLLVIRPLEALQTAMTRCLAMQRALRIGIALRLADPDSLSEPPTAEELGLPALVLDDPMGGDQMVRRQQDGHWLVYSVGSDGVDDGGLIEWPESGDADWDPGIRIPIGDRTDSGAK